VTIYVRNSAFERVAEVDGQVEFDSQVNWSDLGTWKLTLPARHPAALALTYKGGIIVDRGHALPLLSGPLVRMRVTHERTGQRNLVAEGVTDEDAFDARWVAGTFDQTGPAETVMRALVNRDAGPGAPAGRRFPELQLEPDQGRGVRLRARPDPYDNLLTVLRELGLAGGVGFRVVQDGTTRRVLFSTPRDRSRDVVFGFGRGNLLSCTYENGRPSRNAFAVGGQGKGADRRIIVVEDAASIAMYGRREEFLDVASAEDDDYLRQKGAEARVDRSATSGFTIEPVEGPDSTLGEDFEMGDLITFRDEDGAEIVDRCVGSRFKIEKSGLQTLYPVTASEGTTLRGGNIVAVLRRLGRRITHLETGTIT